MRKKDKNERKSHIQVKTLGKNALLKFNVIYNHTVYIIY